MKKKPVINGQFFVEEATGTQRYAREILAELDNLAEKDVIKIIVPEYAENLPYYKNLTIIKYGKLPVYLWEQVSLAAWLIRNKCKSVNFSNTVPLLRRGPTVIHDIAYKVNGGYFTTIYGKLSVLIHRLHYRAAVKSKEPIITVSEYSKKELIGVYGVNPDRITVINNAWQHMLRIDEDNSIFETDPRIVKNGYFFFLGSLAKNKNLRWVLKAAQNNPKYMFVIAGGSVRNYKEDSSLLDLLNVILAGFVSDGQMKAYMKHCKAFLFPSLYEGFGIPPLEAMSVGAKAVVSNASCLPEVYGNSVYYVDPHDSEVDLDVLLSGSVSSPEKTLRKYSWKKSAQAFAKQLFDYMV